MTSVYYCKNGKISYSSFLLCLLSPNLDMGDQLARSRSSSFLENGKTVREPPMMESLYIEITSFSHVHHVCFSINVTKFLSILSQKISWRTFHFSNVRTFSLMVSCTRPRKAQRRTLTSTLH